MSSLTEDLIEPAPNSVTYSSYLKIPELLALQSPLSTPAEHDETLFIIIHQVYELWFKQILHEVTLAAKTLASGDVMPFIRNAKRINAIQKILTHQVDVLETMTPVDFNRFRERLNPASGFQSFQFRLLEFRLGSREPAYLKFHKGNQKAHDELAEELKKPSLYDIFLRTLASRGLPIPDSILNRDLSQSHTTDPGVCAAILKVYRSSQEFYDLYLAMEAMMDLDEEILLWRFRHVAMVERMIGNRKGTGGSSGAKYLTGTLQKRFFPDLWEARNHLGGDYGTKQ